MANTGFKDVNPEKYYADAVKYLKENGIINGYPDGTYKPDEPVTRGELAQVIYNVMKPQD